METALLGFGLVIVLAAVVGIIFRLVGIPPIVAYLTAGLIAFGVNGWTGGGWETQLAYLPEVGLAFLLFLVGMELDFRKLSEVGLKAIAATVVNLVVVSLAGFGIGQLFGYQVIASIYLGLALSFSSTILVVKSLVDSKDLDSLHGRLSLGILLIQDILAILVLMGLSIKTGGVFGLNDLGMFVVKGVLLGVVVSVLGREMMPRVLKLTSRWGELLFLTAVSTCFLVGGIAQLLGFSFGIGAFLAGLALGSSDYRIQIAAKVKPLRDLFVAVFFIDMGMALGRSFVTVGLGQVVLLLMVVMIVKPIVFLLTLHIMEFRRFTAFWVSLSLSQVSEFSLIMLAVLAGQGRIGSDLLSSVAIVTVLSMVVSGVLIGFGKRLYKIVSPMLWFIKSVAEGANLDEDLNGHAVLIGCDRSGMGILKFLQRNKEMAVVVVDFNPDVHAKLKQEGVKSIFGDISEEEVALSCGLNKADLIISTVRDMDDSLAILDYLKRARRLGKCKVVMSAQTQSEAEVLEKRGATDVVVPMMLEGEHIVNILKESL